MTAAALTCEVCPRHCRLIHGATGFCGARANISGRIEALCYGYATSLALDPIEKKPLRRFHPGSKILSWGGWGCNLRCPFCQNSSITLEFDEARDEAVEVSPEQLVDVACELTPRNNIGIAFTYNEPTTSLEYLLDCAELAHARGLATVLVTNGYVCEKPWRTLMQAMDAVNIDLKSFSPAFYAGLGASDGLEVVKRSIGIAAELTHVEVTTLVVPQPEGFEGPAALPGNDSPEEVAALAAWLASIDPAIPLHLTGFWPRYRLSHRQPTGFEAIARLSAIAREKLQFVYGA